MTYRPPQPSPTIKTTGGHALGAFLVLAITIACAGIAYLMGWWRP
jgi:hypothetical protein